MFGVSIIIVIAVFLNSDRHGKKIIALFDELDRITLEYEEYNRNLEIEIATLVNQTKQELSPIKAALKEIGVQATAIKNELGTNKPF